MRRNGSRESEKPGGKGREGGAIEEFLQEACQLEARWVREYGRRFAQNFIGEAELPDLSHELLKEMGITAVGHRIRILKAIRGRPVMVQEDLPGHPYHFPEFGILAPRPMPRLPSPPPPISPDPMPMSPDPAPASPALAQEPTQAVDCIDLEEEEEEGEGVGIKEEEDPFDDDHEDDLGSVPLRTKSKSEDFEGLVRPSPVVSSRPSAQPPPGFHTLPSEEDFAAHLTHAIQAAYRTCQIYPRAHQLQVMQALLNDLARKHAFGHIQAPDQPLNYLLQHSMGSGKSLVLACLVYFLSTMRQKGERLYDVVVVMNDRKQLDMQLWLTVSRFLMAHGLPVDTRSRPTTSQELYQLLTDSPVPADGPPLLVFATIQKFIRVGTMARHHAPPPTHRIAILADEAHRSHGHRGSRLLHDFMTGETRQQMNLTYFSFTSTPTVASLEMFGVTRHANVKEPFHTYSISEAIEDGHILNPLAHYTTVTTTATFEEADWETDPQGEGATPSTRARFHQSVQQLTRAAASNTELLRSRARFLVRHWVEEVWGPRAEGPFTPKAMLVAHSRLAILRYLPLLQEEIARLPASQQFEVACGFTPFEHEGHTYYEEEANPRYGAHYLREFQDPASRVKLLVVHSKFLIGFDEPLLHTMYIDRRLYGTTLVQALGRLCRIAPGKQDTCVVDFVNPRKTVADVFGLYWNKTTVRSFRNFDSDKQKFRRVVEKLCLYECLVKKHEPERCLAYFQKEQLLAPQIFTYVSRLITKYIRFADALQSESPNLHITKLRKLQQLLSAATVPTDRSVVQEAQRRMRIHVSEVSTAESGAIDPHAHKTHRPSYGPSSTTRAVSMDPPVQMNAGDLIRTVGDQYQRQQVQLRGDSLHPSSSSSSSSSLLTPPPPVTLTQPVTGMSKGAMEFAKNLLRRTGEKQREAREASSVSPPPPPDRVSVGSALTREEPAPPSKEEPPASPDSLHSSSELRGSQEGREGRVALKLVPRVVEISKAFQMLEAEASEEVTEGLMLLHKHVEFADNKIALQNKNLIQAVLALLKAQDTYEPHDAQLLTALQILCAFCDCTNDVDKCVSLGILPQLSRFLKPPAPDRYVMACCRVVQRLGEIGSDALVAKISSSEIIPHLNLALTYPHLTPETQQEIVRTLARLGGNMLCLQKMDAHQTIVILLDMLETAQGPLVHQLCETLTRFAQANQSIRNSTRNSRKRHATLSAMLESCDIIKHEAVLKFIRYIWGSPLSKKRSRPTPPGRGRGRAHAGRGGAAGALASRDSHTPPPKRPRLAAEPLYKTQHTISYAPKGSERLRPPSASSPAGDGSSPSSTPAGANAFDYSPAARMRANRPSSPYWRR